jgi:hypothetical protein
MCRRRERVEGRKGFWLLDWIRGHKINYCTVPQNFTVWPCIRLWKVLWKSVSTLQGYTAESGVPICHLPKRVALQSWRCVIRVFTCTNGIHVFRSPYSSRFLDPQCNAFPTARKVLLCASVQHWTACSSLFLGATILLRVLLCSLVLQWCHVLNVVREYVERLQGMSFVPRFSYGRGWSCLVVFPTRYVPMQ